jgi:hypothetical protein
MAGERPSAAAVQSQDFDAAFTVFVKHVGARSQMLRSGYFAVNGF